MAKPGRIRAPVLLWAAKVCAAAIGAMRFYGRAASAEHVYFAGDGEMALIMKDVVIIGGGPGGLLAAKTAVENGLSAVVIEARRSYDKLNRACSQQFILDDDYEGEGIQVEDGCLNFPKSGFKVPYTGKLVPIYNKYYHSPKNKILRFARQDGKEPFSYKFDKQYMLKELYMICKDMGVDFMLGTIACGGKDNGGHVEVEIKNENGRSVVCGKKLVIAEGANAGMCTKFGLNEGRPHIASALTVKYIMSGMTGVENNSWNLYYGRAYRSNAAIIIGPSLYGDGIYEVTITGDAKNKPNDIFAAMSTDSPLKENFANAKIEHKMGCMVKAYMSMMDPCKGNIIAIGDAAAFIEVEVQGAFLCGHHAANAIKAELNGENGFEQYTKWWQDAFEFNNGDHLKVSQGYALVPVYTDDELDYLFGLAEGECLYGTYSQYKTPKLMWDRFLAHVDKIKAERPDMYAKIEKLNSMSLSAAIGK